jgi:hypothetical protein
MVQRRGRRQGHRKLLGKKPVKNSKRVDVNMKKEAKSHIWNLRKSGIGV